MKGLHTLLALACMAALVCVGAHALQFDIETGFEKCLGDEYSQDVLIVGAFKISPSYSTQVYIKVLDPAGALIWKEEDANEGSFAFTTEKFGEHKICFISMGRRDTGAPNGNIGQEKRTVVLQIKVGADAKDYDKVATEQALGPLELEMKKLEDTMVQLNKEMMFIRAREAVMRDTNESTNARVLWFSVLSMVILLVLGAWQLYYLKRFFQEKKLI